MWVTGGGQSESLRLCCGGLIFVYHQWLLVVAGISSCQLGKGIIHESRSPQVQLQVMRWLRCLWKPIPLLWDEPCLEEHTQVFRCHVCTSVLIRTCNFTRRVETDTDFFKCIFSHEPYKISHFQKPTMVVMSVEMWYMIVCVLQNTNTQLWSNVAPCGKLCTWVTCVNSAKLWKAVFFDLRSMRNV